MYNFIFVCFYKILTADFFRKKIDTPQGVASGFTAILFLIVLIRLYKYISNICNIEPNKNIIIIGGVLLLLLLLLLNYYIFVKNDKYISIVKRYKSIDAFFALIILFCFYFIFILFFY